VRLEVGLKTGLGGSTGRWELSPRGWTQKIVLGPRRRRFYELIPVLILVVKIYFAESDSRPENATLAPKDADTTSPRSVRTVWVAVELGYRTLSCALAIRVKYCTVRTVRVW